MNPFNLNLPKQANVYEQLQNQLADSRNQIKELLNGLLATKNTV